MALLSWGSGPCAWYTSPPSAPAPSWHRAWRVATTSEPANGNMPTASKSGKAARKELLPGDGKGGADVAAAAVARAVSQEVDAHACVLRFSDLEVKQLLGRGTFGEVFEASLPLTCTRTTIGGGSCVLGEVTEGDGSADPDDPTRRRVAVKKLLVNETLEEKDLRAFHQELSILSRIHHPHIIGFVACCLPPDPLCIITELAKCSLDRVLRDAKNEDIPWERRIKFCRHIAAGLNHLHTDYKTLHLDVKPQNVLVGWRDDLKLADFGVSKQLLNSLSVSQHGAGTVAFSAPEVFQGLHVTAAADVYSFGICAWTVRFRSFRASHYSDLFDLMLRGLLR